MTGLKSSFLSRFTEDPEFVANTMLRSVLPLALLAGAAAFAPGAVLPSTSRNVAAVGPTMQRIGSARPAGGSTGGQGSQGKQGSMAGRVGSAGRQGSVTPQRTGSMIPQRQASVAPVAKKAAPVKKAVAAGGGPER